VARRVAGARLDLDIDLAVRKPLDLDVAQVQAQEARDLLRQRLRAAAPCKKRIRGLLAPRARRATGRAALARTEAWKCRAQVMRPAGSRRQARRMLQITVRVIV